MFTSPQSRQRTASARRQFLAVVTAAFVILQPILFNAPRAAAQVTPTLGTPYTQSFDTLPASGSATWTNNSTIPGWFHARTGTGTTIVANNGSSNAGNLYSYGTGTDTDRALGSLGSGNAAIGNLFWGLRIQNNTGSTITQLDVSYTGEQWRNSAAAAQTVSFSYLVGSPTVTGSLAEFQSAGVAVSQLDFTSPITGGAAGALDGNLAANRVTLTHSITGLSIPNETEIMLRWSDPDHTGADHGLSIDDFSVTASAPTPTDPAPSVSSTNPADNAINIAPSSNITVTFSEAVNAPDGAFTINCATSGAHTFVRSTADNITFTLNPDSDFSSNEVCTVTVDAEQVNDTDTDDTPPSGDFMAADFTFDFTTADLSTCGTSFTPIFTIQGSGTASPLDGSAVTTEGIVTAAFLNTGINGYYIQDPSGDANTATSDGIFVFDGTTNASVAVGDRVRVAATVDEFNELTELVNTTSVLVCSTGNVVPPPTVVDLPEPVNGDLERYENMLTTFPETLTVTGNFTLGRFGELVLSSDGRLFQQNNFNRTNSAEALAIANLNERRYIVLDDGDTAQNPDPTPYFDANNTRRTGDTVAELTGILTFSFGEYRVQPTVAPVFAAANPRTNAPDAVGGNLTVSSFNVLNYFNGNGAGGGFPTSRGADSLAEFNRQRAKIIAAMIAINADVFGVIEIENDGNDSASAIQDLVNGLNTAAGAGTYVFTEGTTPGTDEIKNSIIYKPSVVTPDGPAVNDTDSIWAGQARNPLAQTFTLNSNGEKFTFIVNHFTSKGCSANDTGEDADQGDGEGCDSLQRELQAQRLLEFVDERQIASGDDDVLVMGDINAAGEEDPIFILENDGSDSLGDGPGGLIDQAQRYVPASSRYTSQFDSQFAIIDHAMATKSLNPFVSGTTIWHINADEPTVVDYNVEFKSAAQQAINQGTPFRSSDHDPVIVGLNLTDTVPQVAGTLIISEFRFRGPGPVVEAAANSAKGVHRTAVSTGGVNANGSTPQSEDEFVELYNNTDSDIVVETTDGSAGWTIVSSTGNELFRIDNGTTIPARAHYLGTNAGGYSLSDYGGIGAAEGDVAWVGADIPDGGGVAIFRTNNPANYTLDERLDAAGYTTAPELYREGAGFAVGVEASANLEYSFFRDFRNDGTGHPKDTGNNVTDFLSADTNHTAGLGQGQKLGAPGPENLASPIQDNSTFDVLLLDPNASSSSPTNRTRKFCPGEAEECNPNRSMFGTMSIRRTFRNNTGGDVTQLRFRIVDVTTFPPPNGTTADLRAISSEDITVNVNGTDVDVRGTQLEEPPTQALGGGWNSSMNVGFITLEEPLPDGDSVSVQFLVGVQQTGSFRFFINIEAVSVPNDSLGPLKWDNVTRTRKK